MPRYRTRWAGFVLPLGIVGGEHGDYLFVPFPCLFLAIFLLYEYGACQFFSSIDWIVTSVVSVRVILCWKRLFWIRPHFLMQSYSLFFKILNFGCFISFCWFSVYIDVLTQSGFKSVSNITFECPEKVCKWMLYLCCYFCYFSSVKALFTLLEPSMITHSTSLKSNQINMQYSICGTL